MKTVKPGIDAAFVEKQRRQLQRLRAILVAGSRAAESEEADVRAQRTSDSLGSSAVFAPNQYSERTGIEPVGR